MSHLVLCSLIQDGWSVLSLERQAALRELGIGGSTRQRPHLLQLAAFIQATASGGAT